MKLFVLVLLALVALASSNPILEELELLEKRNALGNIADLISKLEALLKKTIINSESEKKCLSDCEAILKTIDFPGVKTIIKVTGGLTCTIACKVVVTVKNKG